MKRPLRSAACVAVGDELLEGRHPDLNSPVIAAALLELGLPTAEVHVVGDHEAPLAELVRGLCERRDLVVLTGGLGPTLDDVSRHAVARAADVALVESPAARSELEAWFARTGMSMSVTNLRQALLPEGAHLLPNRRGTAPGFAVEVGRAVVACLPGPPSEMRPMLEEELLPHLCASIDLPDAVAHAAFYLYGISESAFAESVGEWMDRERSPLMGVTAKEGVLSVRLVATAGKPGEARAVLAAARGAFLERLGAHVFSEEDPRLEHVVGRELIAAGRRVALAESCTVGLAASLLGSVPGISAVLDRSWVTYSDAAKVEELGVDPAVLLRHGAVSEEVAVALASGARARAAADIAVSITGVAGPDGGTELKPVGLVWFGVSSVRQTVATWRRFPAIGRDRVRRHAALTALLLLRDELRAGRDDGN